MSNSKLFVNSIFYKSLNSTTQQILVDKINSIEIDDTVGKTIDGIFLSNIDRFVLIFEPANNIELLKDIHLDRDKLMNSTISHNLIEYLNNIYLHLLIKRDYHIENKKIDELVYSLNENTITHIKQLRESFHFKIYQHEHLDKWNESDSFRTNLKINLGISNKELINMHRIWCTSKLPTKELLNYIDLSEENFFAMKEKYVIDGIGLLTPLCDQLLYLSHYKQWFASFTTYTNNGISIKRHNHWLINYINMETLDSFKTHPTKHLEQYKDVIKNNVNEYIDKLNRPFIIDNRFKSNDRIIIINNGIDLYHEGLNMSHCVGGPSYIEKGIQGDMVFAHVLSDHDDKGFTVSFKKSTLLDFDKDTQIYLIDQMYGYKNTIVYPDDREYIMKYIFGINDLYESIKQYEKSCN